MRNFFTKIERYLSSDSSVSFWYLPIKYPFNVDYNHPCFYYLDFSEKLRYKGPYDKNNIPMLNYKGSIGIRYNPCAIAQYGLGALFNFGKTEDHDLLNKALLACEWLSNNLKEIDPKKQIYLWLYDFDLKEYSVKSPWASALAQGQGISLLVRMYKLSGNEIYASKASQAFKSFHIKIEEGGLLREINEGKIYEEVPTRKLSCVLDGFIYSLLGLYDLFIFLKDFKAYKLFIEGVETLERILPRYDLKFWSKADLYIDKPPMIASLFYHKIHIYQLKILYELTNREIFKFYAEKWMNYLNNKFFRALAILYKSIFKIFFY